MPVGRAFGIAFGLTFAVFGLLFIVWRSSKGDRTASVLRVLLTLSTVSMLVGSGTMFLLMKEPNVFVSAGMGVFLYTAAFKILFWDHLRRILALSTAHSMFRIYFSGNVAAASLCGIGSVIHGGPIGVLGAFLSFSWASLYVWLLRRITPNQSSNKAAQP